jgi:predicted TPR repeat methyltransferase
VIEGDDAFDLAKAAFLRGLAAFEAANLREAEAAFEAARQWMPARPSVLGNLGAVQVKLGKPEAALEVLRMAARLEPGNAQHWAYQGEALQQLGRHAEAGKAFQEAAQLLPAHVGLQEQAALALLDAGDYPAGLEALDRLLKLELSSSQAAGAWLNKSTALRELGKAAEAILVLDQAESLGAPKDLVDFYRAGLRAQLGLNDPHQAAPAAPRAYVEALFDSYGGEFESHLVGALGYQAPQRLLAPMLAAHPEDAKPLAVLDLGCGSGLCAPLLRPHAGSLVGLDLSGKMLERARQRDLYDELVHADAVEWLQSTTKRFDWVVATDVLIYVGNPLALIQAVASRLLTGGRFCFTVEMLAGDPAGGYALNGRLRYAHSRPFLERQATDNGLAVVRMEEGSLRNEQGQAVKGLYVEMQKT